MFIYMQFHVEIFRQIDVSALRWPERSEMASDSGLGCNRAYADLRGLSWSEAKTFFALEGELIARIEDAADIDAEWETIEGELAQDDLGLLGLDLGVASTVASLSAARCVPFSSCNAGAFGGDHHEAYPLVAFFARPQMAALILAAATASGVGLENGPDGCIVVYADDVRNLRRFAECLISKRSLFRAVRIGRTLRAIPEQSPNNVEQYRLPFE
jgi:hypothetical protein